jgi:hypothetical protein
MSPCYRGAPGRSVETDGKTEDVDGDGEDGDGGGFVWWVKLGSPLLAVTWGEVPCVIE